ncbi:MAG TPA: hypothetical protein VFL69_06130 [Marmoricola sp.]|nr:hypothetical protein [Marmoricola sp.]
MRPTDARDLDTSLPFTRAEAAAAGLDLRALRGSRFRMVLRGVYVDAAVPDSTDLAVRAALKLHPPSAFASHHTAAEVLGLPVPDSPDLHVSVLRREDRSQRQGIDCHLAPQESHIVRRRGIRVAAPLELFVQLAGSLGLVDLVVLGDAMVRKRLVGADDLVEHCRSSGVRHARAARRAAAYVRAEVDSPMESRLRMLIVLAGLPEPEVNHQIRDADGHVLRRFDLSYPGLRLIVEYDGRPHVEVVDNWESDLERREQFDEWGWRIIVVTSRGIYREPARTVDRVHRALRRAGARPPRPGTGWRRHFPGRA